MPGLVGELKTRDDGLTLTGETISKYRFLTQLLTGFKAEFANLNQSLRDRYSNYYVDTMPLLLADNDISFTLYNINFDNIVDLLEGTPQAILFKILPFPSDKFLKEHSVLAWAGQGYPEKKLTPKNFLNFYKKNIYFK